MDAGEEIAGEKVAGEKVAGKRVTLVEYQLKDIKNESEDERPQNSMYTRSSILSSPYMCVAFGRLHNVHYANYITYLIDAIYLDARS